MSDLQEWEQQIEHAMGRDRFSLRRLIRSIQHARKAGRPHDRNLKRFEQLLHRSLELRKRRAASVPKISYPEDLPVTARRDEIAAAIERHQVVIVCGETGSGKSTQLPKIALELGRGVGGVIGHTQPRRIAARSVAARVAEELSCEVGREVGYRIRFHDKSRPETLIRLMTDGIMLAETQSDRFLEEYDTIIVDEAHERSLNIDFLLGYLKRLLPRRPDLRLIITSATIDAERFAAHFESAGVPAPVILVEGRTFPVEVRYRPLDFRADDEDGGESVERDWLDAVADAVDEVTAIDNGHVLVFLPTERDIREAEKRLKGRPIGHASELSTEVVPLFGRLSMSEQARVFSPCQHRRIVLATNVAESSLTVPGIRYVIDTGTARISRYSARSRIQRLPIEPVSQASASQRAGRCGRVGPGICVRLYSEEDLLGREEFTPPEIQRTNLAAVILRTLHLKLGRLDEFPFLDPPRPTTIREGYKTLEELGAITSVSRERTAKAKQRSDDSAVHTGTEWRLTDIGRQMARLPVDPRISRMILAAITEQAVPEVLVIAAALEIQDPRERPMDKQQQADEAHAEFVHPESDFLTLLNLWDAWHAQKRSLSNNQLKKWCRSKFLSWMRMREWIDVHRQLRELLRESDDPALQTAARLHPVRDRHNDYAAIHRSLLTGLLANAGYKSGQREFTGAGQQRLALWPGSALAAKPPQWFVAAELIETSQRFARTVAKIQPEWIEKAAAHLLKREHSEPHWDAVAGNIMCFEKVSLWGLPIVPRRKVAFWKVDATRCRELLIQHGLVELGLLYGTTADDERSEYAEEERQLISGTRRRITPGSSLRSDPHSAAFRSKTAGGRTSWAHDFVFLQHNVSILEQLKELQARTRQHDLLPTEDWLYDFYDQKIPADVADRRSLKRWYRQASARASDLLKFSLNDFLSTSQAGLDSTDFPSMLEDGGLRFPLTYQLDPGQKQDGVTVSVPAEALAQLSPARLTWGVPGLLQAKVTELIRSLPKSLRRHFVPAPDTAAQVCAGLKFAAGDLYAAVADALSRISGEPVDPGAFQTDVIPDHLQMNIRVVNDAGQTVAAGRDLMSLRRTVRDKLAAAGHTVSEEEQPWHRGGFVDWTFGPVPAAITVRRAGMSIRQYPAIRDDRDSVSLTLCQTPEEASTVMRSGLRRLIQIRDEDRLKRQIRHLPDLKIMQTAAAGIHRMDLPTQLQVLLVERAYLCEDRTPRNKEQFEALLKDGRRRIGVVVQEIVDFVPGLLKLAVDVRRQLKETQIPAFDDVLRDLDEHFSALVHAQMFETTPWPWLLQLPRYLACTRMRLDRLRSGGGAKERELLQDLQPYQQRYRQRLEAIGPDEPPCAMLSHYRWMLEEFRVSLFAQKLGTAIRVSGPRLDEHWQHVK